jgi:HK97 family phage prohead protease
MSNEIITKLAYEAVEADLIEKVKFDGEAGEITAYISSFGNADKVGDVMAPGAFDKTIEELEGKQLPMFLQHSSLHIIGSWTKFEVNARGVKATGNIFTRTTGGSDALELVRQGLIGSTSIGFRSNKYETDQKTGGRLFKEVELVETSLVINPCNEKAKIVSVKEEDGSINPKKLERLLRDADLTRSEAKAVLHSAMPQLREALNEALTPTKSLADSLNK